MLRNQVIVDLRHERRWTVVRSGIIDDGATVSIVEEVVDGEMFYPDGTVGEVKFVVGWERETAAEELDVAVAVVGEGVAE